MTNRERVLASLRHQQPDITPYNIGFTHNAYRNMVEYTGDPDFYARIDNCFTILSTTAEGGWKEIAPDIWADEFGVQWNRTVDKDIGVVCNCLVTPETLSAYRLPDADDPSRYACYDVACTAHQDQFIIADIGFSLFERAWTLTGMENLLMAMLDEPAFAHELLERITGIQFTCHRSRLPAQYRRDEFRRRLGPAARVDHGAGVVARVHQAAHSPHVPAREVVRQICRHPFLRQSG